MAPDAARLDLCRSDTAGRADVLPPGAEVSRLDTWQRAGGATFLVAGAFGILGAGAGLGADLALATLVAFAADPHGPGSSSLTTAWLVVLVGLLAVRAVTAAASRHVAALGTRRVLAHIHAELLDRLLQPDRPLSRPDRFGAGAAAVAVLDEVDRLAPYYSRYQVVRLEAVAVPLLCVAAVAAKTPLCAVLLLAATPLVPLYGWLTGVGAATLAAEHAEAARGLAARFHEALVGLHTLVGLGVADQEAARLGERSHDVAHRAVAVLRRAFVATAALELVATLSLALVAVYVGSSLLGYVHFDWLFGRLDLRTGLFALMVAPAYFAPLRAYAAAYHERSEALAVAGVVEAALSVSPPDEPCPVSERRTSSCAQPIDLVTQRLTVAYPGHGVAALADVDLEIPAGATVVVVGPSGAGKSTLLAALAGEIGAERRGRVTWNGTDVAELPVGSRRAGIGWLRQQTYLFPGSVADNIGLGQGHSPHDIARVARLAGLDSSDAGLATTIACLSGGQRQRIAVARLLLRQPPLLLLDEPTAHLDPDAEAELLPVLSSLCRERTTVIATHAAQVLEIADAVVRLERGRAVLE